MKNNDIGYNFYSSNIRYQIILQSAQPIKVVIKFSETIPAGIYDYGKVLTNKLVSISNYSQRHFD